MAHDRKLYRLEFSRGLATTALVEHGAAPNRRGTTITFAPDPQIFGDELKLDPDRVYRLVRSKAYLFAGVEVRWRCAAELLGPQSATPAQASMVFPGGLADYLRERLDGQDLVGGRPFCGTARLADDGSRLDWAIAWPDGGSGFAQSYCNTIPTPLGGTHESGLRMGLVRGLRSFADLGATFFFVTALLNMPLANVTAIMQALPLTVTLAAALVFREPLGWRRLSAIGIGFCGVLLIVRPGVEGFSAWSLFALAAVGLVTIRDLAARRLAHSTPSATVALVGALLIALFAALGTALEGWKPVDLRSGALVSVAGLLVIVGYIASVATMRVGDVGFVSPYRYTGMIWALLLGFVAFGEWPELPTLVGAAIVVATGLFTLYRERVTGRRDRAVAPPSTRV